MKDSKHNRIAQACVTIPFVFITCWICTYMAIAEKPTVSVMENRDLAGAPALVVDGELNLGFYQELSAYFTDVFPFRDQMLRLNRAINAAYTFSPVPRQDGDVIFIGGDTAMASQGDGGGESGAATQSETTAGDVATTMAQATEGAGDGNAGGATQPATAAWGTTATTGQASGGGAEDGGAEGDAEGAQFTSVAVADVTTATTTTTAPWGESSGVSTGASGAAGAGGMGVPQQNMEEIYKEQGASGVSLVSDRAFEVFIYSEERAAKYADVVAALAKEAGIPVYLIVPDTASDLYLPEKYRKPENEQLQAYAFLESRLAGTGVNLVPLYDDFHAQENAYLYFRSDHHWTADGAYIAYRNLGEAVGYTAAQRSAMRNGRLDGFLGSLYKQIFQDPASTFLEKRPDYVKFYYPLYDVQVKDYADGTLTDGTERVLLQTDFADNTQYYNVFFGGDTRMLEMKSGVANGRSLLVVRDSYGHAFLPFLANNYETVYAIEPRYFESFPLAKFAREKKVDAIVFLNHGVSAVGQYWMDWAAQLEKLHTLPEELAQMAAAEAQANATAAETAMSTAEAATATLPTATTTPAAPTTTTAATTAETTTTTTTAAAATTTPATTTAATRATTTAAPNAGGASETGTTRIRSAKTTTAP